LPANLVKGYGAADFLDPFNFVAFVVPSEPVAFARSGGKGKIRFTPKRQRDFMSLVKLAAHQAMNGQPPLAGPIELRIRAVYRVPTSWSKKRAAGVRWRIARPDADNIAKLVADSCNEIIFRDDAQVANLIVQKTYGAISGVTVSVSILEDGMGRANR
jgi:Holliday junction resolvase RusA-like endonuclease